MAGICEDLRVTRSLLSKADLPPYWIALSNGFRRAIKRCVDIGASLLGLALSAPIALLAALAIRIETGSPVLYRQERVGQNDTRFTLYKFRSMSQDAEARGGPVWASQEDPRVTRVSRIIRKLRIDEIPQMVNVLKGEMSWASMEQALSLSLESSSEGWAGRWN